MLLVTVILLIDAKDETYNDICNRRLHCHNECSKMYFPSTFCDVIDDPDLKIDLMGNEFRNFWKFPDPSYVKTHLKSNSNPGTSTKPTYPFDMTVVKPETFNGYQE